VRRIQNFYFLVVLLLASFIGLAETKIDVSISENPLKKFNSLLSAADSLKSIGAYDSAIVQLTKADTLIAMESSLDNPKNKSQLYYAQGMIAQKQGVDHKALHYLQKAIDVQEKDSIPPIHLFYTALANKNLGNYALAAEHYIEAAKKFEADSNHLAVASVYTNLGNVFKQIKRYDEAESYLNKALELAKAKSLDKILTNIYSGLGNIFMDMKDYQSALQQFNQAYKVLGNSDKSKMYSLINIADAKSNLGLKKEALKDLQEALKIAIELKNKKYLLKCYYDIGDFFVGMADQRNAETYLRRAEAIATELKLYPDLQDIYKSYRNLYRKTGNYKKAFDYYEQYEMIKDSVIARENSLQVTQIISEFEFEKKEQALALLQKEKELEVQKSEKHRLEKEKLATINEKNAQFIRVLTILGAVLLIISGIAFFLFISKKKKNQELISTNFELEASRKEITEQRDELDSKNTELAETNAAIEKQKAEIEAQRDLLNQTNSQLSKRNKDVTDSIHYAQKIQQAMLASSFQIEDQLDHFIFYKPRDIVSGDFYWSHVIDDKIVLAIGDCTGHGVPGAFMSCLGMSLLNEIVFERKITRPDYILTELRTSVIKLIAKGKNSDERIGDGMDIAIVLYDTKTKMLNFSGAMNPIQIVHKGEVYEIKGDKSPIGIHIIPDQPFTNHEVQLFSGDTFYLSSDGYKDQFGGPRGKKMGNRNVKEMITEISSKSIPEQRQATIAHYKKWRGNEEQIDDVCFFGAKVN
jgi:serine phosphatase RsbU (regulator of sigma subunit)/cob(I)alamin adenosyltransferase